MHSSRDAATRRAAEHLSKELSAPLPVILVLERTIPITLLQLCHAAGRFPSSWLYAAHEAHSVSAQCAAVCVLVLCSAMSWDTGVRQALNHRQVPSAWL